MKRISLFAAAALAMLSLCCCQEKPDRGAEPVIRLGFDGDLRLPAEGGEESFGYSIESPARDGELQVSAPDADWIGDFAVEDGGRVKFRVDPNGTAESRETAVRLEYVYGGGRVGCSFTAVQEASGGEWTGPVPDVICPDQLVPAEGGQFVVYYYVNDAAEDGVVSFSHEDCSWASDFLLDETEMRLSFTAEPNGGARREFRFTLTYTYGGGRFKDEIEVSVTQLASASEAPDKEREMSYAMGTYNGTDMTYTSVHEYHIYMSNKPFDVPDEYASASASYDVDLFGVAPADPVTMLPAAGEYEYGVTYMKDTFSLYFHDIFGEWHSFIGGTLVLDYDADGNMLLDITATDETGEVHKVTFAGPVGFEDIRDSED